MAAGAVSYGAPVITQSVTAQAADVEAVTIIPTFPTNIKVEYSEKYRQVSLHGTEFQMLICTV